MTFTPFRIPHLYFHRVTDDDAHYTCIPRDKFTAILDTLKDKRRVTSIDEALRWFRCGSQPPPSAIILSFDDGYADLMEFAIPALADRGMTATLFIPTNYIGKRAVWRTDGASLSILSAEALRSLVASGFDVQCHGAAHRALVELDDREIRRESIEAASRLADVTGQAVKAFAYPFGRYDERSRTIVGAFFPLAFSTVKSGETDWRLAHDALRRDFVDARGARFDIRSLPFDSSGKNAHGFSARP